MTHLKLGQIPTVVVSSARLAKEVLKTHDLVLASRPELYAAKHLFYNCSDIAFAPYGPYWRHVRKIISLEVLSTKQVQQYRFIRDEEVARLVNRIRDSSSSSGSGSTVDLSHLLGLYANDVVCRASLGKDFSSGGEYDRHGFQKMLEEYQELLGGLSVGDFFPSVEFVSSLTGMKSRLVNTFRKFDQLFEEIIQEHRDSQERLQNNKDIVNVLLHINRDESREIPLTLDNVKAIMLDMFAAGTDTTFITLEWVMTELITNPRVLRKAQAEVRQIVADRSVVLETDLPNLHYMKAIIKEVFRLHPAAPVLLPRESLQDVVIDGYEIPVKTRIFVNVWAIGRDPELWENPNEFKPERFMGINSIDYRGQDFELIPFGAGRRMCPGISFAIATIEIALAQLLHRFDWELPPGIEAKDLDMTEVFGITMHRKDKLIVVTKPYLNKV